MPVEPSEPTYINRHCKLCTHLRTLDAPNREAQGARYRKQKMISQGMLRTGMFNPREAKYANGLLCQVPFPTDDTRLIIAAAQEGIKRLYRNGFTYAVNRLQNSGGGSLGTYY